ncbi:MAG: ATP-binding protein [Treponema sp.]
MLIERKRYLDKLINKKKNGRVKIITGIRRCGKSYLLFELFHQHLLQTGVNEEDIIEIGLDDMANIKYCNPFELDRHVRELTADTSHFYYVIMDEIQMVSSVQNPYVEGTDAKIGFVNVVLGLMKLKNVDLYISGSNSRMLSSDILTEFKDRGTEIRVNPLTYSEFYSAYTGEKQKAWAEYYTYGGMPYILSLEGHEEKSRYLKDLFSQTYLSDVVNRYKIHNETTVLEDLLNIVSSSTGSLTNTSRLSDTFKTVKKLKIKPETLDHYLDYFIDAFILSKAQRYDVKGKKYIETPVKYYFTDIGLRNARLNFRQIEENHIMENIIYNELLVREFDVDIGVVQYNQKNSEGRSVRTQLEIDFVANKGSLRYYIQSALHIDNEEKRLQETNSLLRVKDSFKKIVVVKDAIVPWHDENGILYVGIEQFLLEETAMNL